MPLIALLHMLIGIGLAYHAQQNGKPSYWIYVVLFVPGAGSLAYILLEVLPDLAFTRRGRRVAAGLTDILNADGEWKRRYEDTMRTDSVAPKRRWRRNASARRMWREVMEVMPKRNALAEIIMPVSLRV